MRLAAGRDDFAKLRALLDSRIRLGLAADDGAALNWQLASVCWRLDDAQAADQALARLLVHSPTHAAARSVAAERALATRGASHSSPTDHARTAAALARVAFDAEAPKPLRTASAVRAVDLLREAPGGHSKSMELLEKSYRAGLADRALLERLVMARAAREDWASTCEALAELRESFPEETKLATLRLEFALRRSHTADGNAPGAEAAAAAVAKLVLERDPDDGEALECVLATEPTGRVATSALKAARGRVEASLRTAPEDTSLMRRYLAIARHAGDTNLQFIVREALRSCGDTAGTASARAEQPNPKSPFSGDSRQLLGVSGSDGPWGALMSTLAPALTTVLGPTLRELGLGRSDRVRNSAELAVLEEIEPWIDALGLTLDVYLGGPDPEKLICVAESTPALVIGEEVRAPLGPDALCALTRELFALTAGSLCICRRKLPELELVLASLRTIAGPSATDARSGDETTVPHADAAELATDAYIRELKRALPRRTLRRACEQLREADASGQSLAVWAAAETLRFARVAAVATGSVRQALTSTYSNDHERLSQRPSLLQWVWGGHLARVRAELGMEGE